MIIFHNEDDGKVKSFIWHILRKIITNIQYISCYEALHLMVRCDEMSSFGHMMTSWCWFSAWLAFCPGPVTRSFDVFFDLCLNKRLCKQSRCWWFETSSDPLWSHCNATLYFAGWSKLQIHIISSVFISEKTINDPVYCIKIQITQSLCILTFLMFLLL